jgi:hypothetical protein
MPKISVKNLIKSTRKTFLGGSGIGPERAYVLQKQWDDLANRPNLPKQNDFETCLCLLYDLIALIDLDCALGEIETVDIEWQCLDWDAALDEVVQHIEVKQAALSALLDKIEREYVRTKAA